MLSAWPCCVYRVNIASECRAGEIASNCIKAFLFKIYQDILSGERTITSHVQSRSLCVSFWSEKISFLYIFLEFVALLFSALTCAPESLWVFIYHIYLIANVVFTFFFFILAFRLNRDEGKVCEKFLIAT
jgi:hypothetical protein